MIDTPPINKTTGKPIPELMKALVRDTVARGRYALNLEEWEIGIHYMEEDITDDSYKGKIAADISVNRRYLSAIIRIYPHLMLTWEKDGDYAIEHCVMHEMSHILTEHLKDLATSAFKDEGELKDAWEILTQRISFLALRVPKQKNDAE